MSAEDTLGESPLATFARQASAVNWTAGSCMVILVYNHVLTLDQEISRIWPTRISPAKVLFLINRYFVEAIIIFNCISASRPYRSPDFCVFYLRWLTVATTISNAAVQGILVLRIWALYRHSKAVLGIAYFFYFGGTITLIGLVIKDYVGEDVFINHSLAALPGCYATSVPSIIAGFWIAPLIVETVLFVIVVSRAYFWWRDGTPTPRILSMLMRDSTLYFAVVFALLLANYLVFELAPPFFSSLLVTPSTTAGCILGSHMFLNLRAMLSSMEASDGKPNGGAGSMALNSYSLGPGTSASRTMHSGVSGRTSRRDPEAFKTSHGRVSKEDRAKAVVLAIPMSPVDSRREGMGSPGNIGKADSLARAGSWGSHGTYAVHESDDGMGNHTKGRSLSPRWGSDGRPTRVDLRTEVEVRVDDVVERRRGAPQHHGRPGYADGW